MDSLFATFLYVYLNIVNVFAIVIEGKVDKEKFGRGVVSSVRSHKFSSA